MRGYGQQGDEAGGSLSSNQLNSLEPATVSNGKDGKLNIKLYRLNRVYILHSSWHV